jgi:hypothetical protein
MNTATIEVAFVNPPKDGKKQATIKTSTGDLFGIWPDKLGLLRPGESYKVDFSERNYNGKTYRTITKVTPGQGTLVSIAGGKRAATPIPDSSEFEFVTRILAAMIAANAIQCEKEELANAIKTLGEVYRETQHG